MIEEPGSFSGRLELAEAGTWPAAQPAQVVGDLRQACRQGREGPAGEDDGIVGGQRGELVRRAHEGQPRVLRDAGGHGLAEARRRVEACPHGGAADGQLVEAGQHLVQALGTGIELRDIAAELLPERQRHGILEVRAADLHDVIELAGARCESIPQAAPARAAARPG